MQMDRMLKNLFLDELLAKARLSKIALSRLNLLLAIPQDQKPLNFMDQLFEALHSYLHNVSAISLILWPSDKGKRSEIQKRLSRGQELRCLLDISEGHILSRRQFRNNLAHMDERLEEWWVESPNRIIIRQVFSERNFANGVGEGDVFELYVPSEKVYVFRGKAYNIQTSIDAVEDIERRAIAVRERLHAERFGCPRM